MSSRNRLAKVRGLLAPGDSSLVEAGRVLRDEYHEGNLLPFCGQVPIHHRKARTLISIAEAVDCGRFAEEAVAAIGWAKAARIVEARIGKIRARNAARLAAENTLPSLKRFLAGDKEPARLSKVFSLPPKDALRLEKALLAHGATKRSGRIVGREMALMSIICQVELPP